MKQTVIVTDLDGTLLDEESYAHAPALSALERIAETGTPLVFCSSKTRAELERYRARLGNVHPFVSENGGGIFVPEGYFPFHVSDEVRDGYRVIRLGIPYEEIRARFVELREMLGVAVRGFGDMSVEDVAALTGLAIEEAELAKRRDFDEPFVFDGEPDAAFLRAIEADGLNWTQGRLFHILGRHDKGRAVDMLMSLYRRKYGGVASIGLGDSLNDLPMLSVVDKPVLVRHNDGSCDERIVMVELVKTRLPGPAGWNEAVLAFLPPPADVAGVSGDSTLKSIFNAALAAVDPCEAVLRMMTVEGDRMIVAGEEYDLSAFERIVVVGAGKAAAPMAQAVESLLGQEIAAGLVVVKTGHTARHSFGEPAFGESAVIEQIEAAHPIPDQAGVEAAQRILGMVHAADENTLIICLLSGGASALLVSPVEGVTLQDKQFTTRLLLNAGASIGELNAVRKHLSRVKGGGLAKAAYPARLVTLILSDVIGDPLDVIASGPTVPDGSTYADALAVIRKFELTESMPTAVIEHLKRGQAGRAAETVKIGDPCLAHIQNVIVANLSQALEAAHDEAVRLGLPVRLVSDHFQGEARVAAQWLVQTARAELGTMKPDERRCLLCGGETTVTVRGSGRGGRNQEFALAFALKIEGVDGISLLSAGTDGSDGPTDAAGALVDGRTAEYARRLGLDPQASLDNNDSWSFFHEYDALSGAHSHFKTGPTGTNVMDMQVVLLEKPLRSRRKAERTG